MAYLYAVLGFIALIVLHEAGHFTAAKLVGMRVERFALFFPPLIAKVRRGETEYGIGSLPFGGYVKITGMSPHEDIPPEVLPRAYYNQPVWKRIVVIAAGPAVNIVIAIGLAFAILLISGEVTQSPNRQVSVVTKSGAAAGVLKPGDRLVSVDGVSGSSERLRRQIISHRCAGAQTDGCRAATPARLVIRRDGRLRQISIRPRNTTVGGQSEMLIGIEFGLTENAVHVGAGTALTDSVSRLWYVSKKTVSTVVRVFEPKERKQLNSVVGGYTVTERSFKAGSERAFEVLALISLSLGLINLFPFLPLDGGHIFWALAEKVRGKRIPFVVMERAGMVGFLLILAIFAIGLTNDIHSLSNGGLQVH